MPDSVDPSILVGHWVHSHEEDTADTRVFRPGSRGFPPSRGRQGFELDADGTLVERGPGPVDRTVTRAGTWHLDADDRLVLRVPGRPDQVFEVELLDREQLIVRKP